MPRIFLSLITTMMVVVSSISVSSQTSDVDTHIEQVLENSPDSEMDALEQSATIQALASEPVNINSPASVKLVDAGLISHLEYQALTAYIRVHGVLVSIYELQAVPFFTLPLIRIIRPLIKLGNGQAATGYRLSIRSHTHHLLIRWQQNIERSAGYDNRPGSTHYLGNPSGLFFRYQFHSPGIRMGILAEKDPGEPLFRRNLRTGFDHLGFYLSIGPINKCIKQVIVGDYSITLGHGLVHQSGYSVGKNSQTVMLMRGSNPLAIIKTPRESGNLRGLALLLSPTSKINIKGFLSHVNRDATVSSDTLSQGASALTISSIKSSGLHRTSSEVASKGTTGHLTAGGSVSMTIQKLQASVNVIHHAFEHPFKRANEPYRRHRFYGKSITNVSFSYQGVLGNTFLFGEIARSPGNTFAITQGVMASLNRKLRVALYTRHLPKGYQHYGGRTLSETSRPENETGLYLGAEYEINNSLRINAYSDIWRNPAPTFQFDYPGQGDEQLLRITYHKRHEYSMYIQLKSQRKIRNQSIDRIRTYTNEHRSNIRLHINRKINKSLELRSRFELSMYHLTEARSRSTGSLIYQDILYKPIGGIFSFTSRIAVFHIPVYDARIYAYENDLSQQFSIPAYYGIGSRVYLNFRYSGVKGLNIEFRVAQTWLTDREKIGSGLDQLPGNRKTTMKVQVRYMF